MSSTQPNPTEEELERAGLTQVEDESEETPQLQGSKEIYCTSESCVTEFNPGSYEWNTMRGEVLVDPSNVNPDDTCKFCGYYVRYGRRERRRVKYATNIMNKTTPDKI